MDLAGALKAAIESRLPNYRHTTAKRWPKTRDSWAKSFRLAYEQDKRPWEELRETLAWSQSDAFWQANILSADKLRQKYDTLRAQMARGTTATKQDVRVGHYRHTGDEVYAGGVVEL